MNCIENGERKPKTQRMKLARLQSKMMLKLNFYFVMASGWCVLNMFYNVFELICCACFRDASAELFCLQVFLTVFLLLFLFGSYSTGRLWYKSLRTGKQWHKLHVIYLLFKDHHLIFIILSPLFLTYFVIFVIYGFRQLPSYLLQLFSAKRTRKPTILCDGKSNQDQNLHWKEETCYGTDLWW